MRSCLFRFRKSYLSESVRDHDLWRNCSRLMRFFTARATCCDTRSWFYKSRKNGPLWTYSGGKWSRWVSLGLQLRLFTRTDTFSSLNVSAFSPMSLSTCAATSFLLFQLIPKAGFLQLSLFKFVWLSFIVWNLQVLR